ncbi:MAG: hypothetical protein JWP02_1587, partial [Acidimicrobiales bacterium]|nr:hypothetical protein [Acidimicrobiales bacterium]
MRPSLASCLRRAGLVAAVPLL